jgi:hypothetical protein
VTLPQFAEGCCDRQLTRHSQTIAGVEVDRDLRGGGEVLVGTKTLVCATCGAALDSDPDEDASGDGGRPICGECARARDFFAPDVADGSLDDYIDLSGE